MNNSHLAQPMKTEEATSLDSLLANPSSIATLPPEMAQQVLICLASIQPILLQRALAVRSVGGDDNELLTIPEVAKRLKVSDYRAYELARQGAFKSVRLGKSVRVKPEDLAAYLAKVGG